MNIILKSETRIKKYAGGDGMKLGTFEISGRKRLGAFEKDWAIDLSAAYLAFLSAGGGADAESKANDARPR